MRRLEAEDTTLSGVGRGFESPPVLVTVAQTLNSSKWVITGASPK